MEAMSPLMIKVLLSKLAMSLTQMATLDVTTQMEAMKSLTLLEKQSSTLM
jgi:hypothetical protein